ncbi:MAG TPA: (d)CMP kinase [Gemmatimonadales bacterium]|nr:(d)CMP kinase [Gemmatimonadales bacterium]
MNVIALDGPSASGKSSTARAVAQALGWSHLDSGALYRGLTLVALEIASARGRTAESLDPRAILEAAEGRGLRLHSDGTTFLVYLDGLPKDDAIRTPEVTAHVSAISAMPDLRLWVDQRMRQMVHDGLAVVIDGRDIGSVVFPEAPLKVFLTATPEARAGRRLSQRGMAIDPAALARESGALAARDHKDSTREVAPLIRAPGALLLDSTALSFQEQVDWIVARAKERGLG